METMKDILREEQLVQVQTLKKLDAICRKYGIQYWMAFGSLLGTIRHHGFIPWDDDLDVGMMREDFEKLLRVPAEEWGEDLLFCAPASDEERHDKFFGRIYVRNSRVQSRADVENWRRWSDNQPWSTSLMCDVFIFDRVPEDHDKYMRIRKLFDKRKKLYKMTKLKPWTTSGSIKKKIKALSKRTGSRILRRLWREPWRVIDRKNRETALRNQGNHIGSYYASTIRDPRGTQTFPPDYFFPLREAQFEGMTVYVPNQYDKMLTSLYGDYMTPPPEDKRHHLTPIFLDLGDGIEHVFENVPGSLGDHTAR